MAKGEYPLSPKSASSLLPGQFWDIPLSDGRHACGRVLARIPAGQSGSRMSFIAGLLDWVGTAPPTADTIAGAGVLDVGYAHVRAITSIGSAILGQRDLALDGLRAPDDVVSYYGDAALQSQAEFIFVLGSPLPKFERRGVASPLTKEMLRPFTTPGVVQFGQLSIRDMKRLAAFLETQPDVGLRVFGSPDITDLEFLRWFPKLSDLSIDYLYELESLDGLRHLPSNVQSLAIGDTRKKLDLSDIRPFTELRSLRVEGAKKNLDSIGSLVQLEELSLRSITLPDLSTLTSLDALRSLELKLGGTKDLTLLPSVGQLEHLEIWQVRGLVDISSIGELPHLRYLFLETLSRIEQLPDFSHSQALERIHIEGLKGLTSVEQVSNAPNLRDLVLDVPQLGLEDIRCLAGHQTLKRASVGLGSVKRNDAAQELLGLPHVTEYKPAWRQICDA